MTDWQGIWIVAEQWQGELKRVSFELLGRAKKLAEKLDVPLGAVLLGHQVKEAAQELIYHGADRVYVVDHPALSQFDPDAYTNCLEYLIREERPAIVVAAATTAGRTTARSAGSGASRSWYPSSVRRRQRISPGLSSDGGERSSI